MVERDITAETGKASITKLLPAGWTWKRIPDTANKRIRGVGFDGLLRKGGLVFQVEVKEGNRSLTESERKEANGCFNNGHPYVILRKWPTTWEIELFGQCYKPNGSLVECLDWLESVAKTYSWGQKGGT